MPSALSVCGGDVGSMSLFARRVLLLFLLLAFPFTAYGQIGKPEGLYYKSWGLVIGIENYLVAPKVDGAVADAKAVAHTLRQLGFDEVVELVAKRTGGSVPKRQVQDRRL